MVRVVKTGFGYLMWHKTDLGYLKHDVLIGRSAKTGFECPIVLRIGLDQFGRFHDICWKPILSVPSQLKVFLGLLEVGKMILNTVLLLRTVTSFGHLMSVKPGFKIGHFGNSNSKPVSSKFILLKICFEHFTSKKGLRIWN